MTDHDFRNILGLEREAAEALLTQLQAAEDEAKRRGDHWHCSASSRCRYRQPRWRVLTKKTTWAIA